LCAIAADDNDKDSIQIKLLCGSDVLESFAIPGLWTNEDVSYHRLLTCSLWQYVVCCVCGEVLIVLHVVGNVHSLILYTVTVW